MVISLCKIESFIFDFDGVIINNLFHLDQSWKECVSCIRADEYQGALVWILSDKFSYLNGVIIPIEDGRVAW